MNVDGFGPRLHPAPEIPKKYKANRIMGMNPLHAAIAAGYSKNYAKAKSYRIERLVEVGIRDELEKAGLTAKVQAQALAELTQAKKNQYCDIYIQKDETGKWKINHNMSQFVEVEDNVVRLNAWKHVAELKKQSSSDNVFFVLYSYNFENR